MTFSTATIVASLILFQGFNTENPGNTMSLLAGFAVTFLGIHLLELSRKPTSTTPHSALESGLMNPRLSLTGRPSLDGWADTPTHSHARRGSLYRAQTATLFDTFEEGDAVGLQRLSEEGEDDELEAANERTRLRAEERRSGSRGQSLSNSPHGSQGDLRRS